MSDEQMTPTGCEPSKDTIEALVELGRSVDNCEMHGSTWCSCKVRQYLDLMSRLVAIIPLGSAEVTR